MTKVNLGCGTNPVPEWINIDRTIAPGVQHVLDLDTDPLPFEPGSVDAFRMIHVIEHLRNPLHCLEEAWRAAKHGAPIEIRCPHGASDDAWEDPTHVRAMFPVSFGYFSQPFYWRADYGYRGDWRIQSVQLIVAPGVTAEMIHKERNHVRELRCIMTAQKPARERREELQDPIRPELVIFRPLFTEPMWTD